MKSMKFFVLAALLLTSGSVSAYDFEAGGLYYNLLSVSERTAEVTYQESEYTPTPSYAGTVNIPATVEYQGTTFAVVSIGSYAFYGCVGLTKVTFSEGLRTIGTSAFDGCTHLTDVDLPHTLVHIQDYAFSRCHAFTRLVIPASVTTIGDGAFSSEGVQTVTIEDSSIGIDAGGWGGKAFSFPHVRQLYMGRNCGGWQAPSSLIDGWYGNALARVEFGPQVTEIPYCMLYGDAPHLTEVIFSPNTKTIATGAMSGCFALQRIELPDNLEVIEDGAFGGGWNGTPFAAKDLVIGSKIKSIGATAFGGCQQLQTVTVRRKDAIAFSEDVFPQPVYLTASLYVPEGSMKTTKTTEMQLVSQEVRPAELDSAAWKAMCQEVWMNYGYPEDYYSDTLEIYEIREVTRMGYSETAYWSNFTHISEGEVQPATRWPVTLVVSEGGSVQALGRDIRESTYTENVEEGTSVSVLFRPDEGWGLTALTLNGTDVLADVVDNAYTMPAVASRDSLRVTFSQPEATLTLRTSERGSVKQTVVFGSRCTLQITPETGYVVHSVTFNGEDITESLQADGTLLTPAINGDAVLSVAFEEGSTGITEARASALRVLPGNGFVTVLGLPLGAPVSAYTPDGVLVTKRIASSATEQIALPTGKVYIIHAEGRSVKVSL